MYLEILNIFERFLFSLGENLTFLLGHPVYSIIRFSTEAANFITELWREEREFKQNKDPPTNLLPIGFNPKVDGQGRYIENLGRISVCLHILFYKILNHKCKNSFSLLYFM